MPIIPKYLARSRELNSVSEGRRHCIKFDKRQKRGKIKNARKKDLSSPLLFFPYSLSPPGLPELLKEVPREGDDFEKIRVGKDN
jgi:hypothetical protein